MCFISVLSSSSFMRSRSFCLFSRRCFLFFSFTFLFFPSSRLGITVDQWFESLVMLHKMLMTGAMCVVAPGSSVQLLIAVLVMLLYTMTILKTAPYEEDSEDWSSFISCVAVSIIIIFEKCGKN